MLIKEKRKPSLKQTNNPIANRILYSPGFRAQKHSCDSVARVHQKRSYFLYRSLYLPSVSEGVMGFLGELGGKRIFPLLP